MFQRLVPAASGPVSIDDNDVAGQEVAAQRVLKRPPCVARLRNRAKDKRVHKDEAGAVLKMSERLITEVTQIKLEAAWPNTYSDENYLSKLLQVVKHLYLVDPSTVGTHEQLTVFCIIVGGEYLKVHKSMRYIYNGGWWPKKEGPSQISTDVKMIYHFKSNIHS